MTTTLTKHTISKEAVAAYKKARAIRKSPIPADPEQRQIRQRAFHEASVELERALDHPLGTLISSIRMMTFRNGSLAKGQFSSQLFMKSAR